MTREEAAGIAVPVLIAVGTTDAIAGSAAALGKIIPGSQVLDIPNRDHMRAVGDKVYKSEVLDFHLTAPVIVPSRRLDFRKLPTTFSPRR